MRDDDEIFHVRTWPWQSLGVLQGCNHVEQLFFRFSYAQLLVAEQLIIAAVMDISTNLILNILSGVV